MAIKSGPNWGNSSQIEKMKDKFRVAKKILRTGGNSLLHVEAVNGCCYGRGEVEDKGDYRKLCGQAFWAFISGSETLYADIVEPLGRGAAQRDAAFQEEYAKLVNRLTSDLIQDFCRTDGAIDWERLLHYNSGRKGLILPKRVKV